MEAYEIEFTPDDSTKKPLTIVVREDLPNPIEQLLEAIHADRGYGYADGSFRVINIQNKKQTKRKGPGLRNWRPGPFFFTMGRK